MCFIKSPKIEPVDVQPQEKVQRHQADASATKTSKSTNESAYKQNIKTSPLGLEEEQPDNKKTLLGE